MLKNLKNSTKSYLLLFFILIFFIGCYEDKEGCLDPYSENYNLDADLTCEDCCTYPSLSISMLHRYDSLRLDIDSFYTNDLNQKYIIKSSNFYIKDIHFITEGGVEVGSADSVKIQRKNNHPAWIENSIKIVNPSISTIFSSTIDKTSFGKHIADEKITSIKFNIGLSNLASTIDISLLDTTEILHTSGKYMYDQSKNQYHNAVIQYAFDTSATTPLHHIYIDKNIEIQLDSLPEINQSLGKPVHYTILIDYSKFFSDIDFDDPDPNKIKQKWISNANYAFKIKQ